MRIRIDFKHAAVYDTNWATWPADLSSLERVTMTRQLSSVNGKATRETVREPIVEIDRGSRTRMLDEQRSVTRQGIAPIYRNERFYSRHIIPNELMLLPSAVVAGDLPSAVAHDTSPDHGRGVRVRKASAELQRSLWLGMDFIPSHTPAG